MHGEPNVPSPETVQAHLEKVLASTLFRDSGRLQDMLRFTVHGALSGNRTALKESVLGVEIFGRKPGYDLASNSIVRVEFSRLRGKLDRYYDTDGRHENLRIRFTKGSYAPEFDWNRGLRPIAPTRRQTSLAVLPFVDAGSDRDNEHFADGLADELITALSKVPGLRVVARTSSFEFKGKNADIRNIGAALRVGAVLEGSVRRQGDQIRIHTRLIEVADGCQLWAEKYERRLDDVFAVQDDITRSITEALKVEIPRVRPPTFVPTRSADAHEFYLKGRLWWHRWNPDALARAASYFQQAIAIDPAYAPPYSGLADCYYVSGFYGEQDPRLVMPRAEAAVKLALEKDPSLAEAYCSQGMLENTWRWNSERCADYFRQCLDLNPGYALALSKYATSCLTPQGRHEEALGYILRALDLDPLSAYIRCDLALCYFYQRQYEQFENEARTLLEMNPAMLKILWLQATVYANQGHWSEAVAKMETALSHKPDHAWSLGILGWIHNLAGNSAGAADVSRRLHALQHVRFVPQAAFLMLELGSRDCDRAFVALESALAGREPFLRFLRVFPIFDVIRSDPRYEGFLRRVGL